MSRLGAYSGTAGDALRYHKGQPFSTYDMDNGPSPENCALRYLGAWWYNDCHHSNLFAMYFAGEYNDEMFAKGMVWFEWRGMLYAFKDMKMMIRPKSCSC
uniref:GK21679 n=2 Tax=Drosophila willistoni TaxID=7260 RepID=B4MPB6_DROWI